MVFFTSNLDLFCYETNINVLENQIIWSDKIHICHQTLLLYLPFYSHEKKKDFWMQNFTKHILFSQMKHWKMEIKSKIIILSFTTVKGLKP